MFLVKSLLRYDLWWSRWDSNPRPLRCELAYRQKRKLLPFRKLQPPKKNRGFPLLSYSLPSRRRRVQLILATYWPLGNESLSQEAALRCRLGSQFVDGAQESFKP